MSIATPDIIEEISLNEEISEAPVVSWRVIVSNDPINLVTFVCAIFQKILELPYETAMKYTLQVHNEGKAAVFWGNEEECKDIVAKLLIKQLWAHAEKDS